MKSMAVKAKEKKKAKLAGTTNANPARPKAAMNHPRVWTPNEREVSAEVHARAIAEPPEAAIAEAEREARKAYLHAVADARHLRSETRIGRDQLIALDDAVARGSPGEAAKALGRRGKGKRKDTPRARLLDGYAKPLVRKYLTDGFSNAAIAAKITDEMAAEADSSDKSPAEIDLLLKGCSEKIVKRLKAELLTKPTGPKPL